MALSEGDSLPDWLTFPGRRPCRIVVHARGIARPRKNAGHPHRAKIDARQRAVFLKKPTVLEQSRDQADGISDNGTRSIQPNSPLGK